MYLTYFCSTLSASSVWGPLFHDGLTQCIWREVSCSRSGRQALQAEHKRAEGHICPLAQQLRVVCRSLGLDAGGWVWAEMAYWVMAHRHASFWGSSTAAVGSGLGVVGGSPIYMMHSSGPHVSLWTETCRWLFIHIKPRHWVISEIPFGLSNYHDYGSTFELESQTKHFHAREWRFK